VNIHDVRTVFTGAESGGALTNEMWRINGTCYFDYDGGDLIYNVTGATANTHRYIDFGPTSPAVLAGAIMRRFRIRSFVGDTAPKMLFLNSSALLTINTEAAFTDCDFTNMPVGGLAFQITVTAGPKVRVERCKEPTWPKSRIAVGANQFTNFPFVTATISQYIGGYSGTTMISGGTVTLIEVSTDGVNFDTVGTTGPVAIPTRIGTRIRLTFTVAPTVNFQFDP
jgi:hypothetical protein